MSAQEPIRYSGGSFASPLGIFDTVGGRALYIAADGGAVLGKTSGKVSFFGGTAVVKPTVPLTTPDAQDIIDALLLLGLIAQSD